MPFGKAPKTSNSPNATKLANELNALCKKLKAAMDKKKNLTTNKFVVMYDKSCILRSQLEGMAMSLLDAKDSKQFDYVAEISHRSSKILSNYEKMTNRPTFQTNLSSLTNITNTNVGSNDSFNSFASNNANHFSGSTNVINSDTNVSNKPSTTTPGFGNLSKTPDLFKDRVDSNEGVGSFNNNNIEDIFSDAQGWANFDDADNFVPSQSKSKLKKFKSDNSFDGLDNNIVYKKDYLDSNMDTALDHFNTSVDYNLSFDSTDNLDKDNQTKKVDDGSEFETEVKYKESHKVGYGTDKKTKYKDRDNFGEDREKDVKNKGRKGKEKDKKRDYIDDKEVSIEDHRNVKELKDYRYNREEDEFRNSKQGSVDRKYRESDKNDYIKLLERCLLQTKHKSLVYQLNNEEMGSDYKNKVNIVNSYLNNSSYHELEDQEYNQKQEFLKEYPKEHEGVGEYRGNYRDEFDSRRDLGYRGYVDLNFREDREYSNVGRETRVYREHSEPGYRKNNREHQFVDKSREYQDREASLIRNQRKGEKREGELTKINEDIHLGFGLDGMKGHNKNEMYNEFRNSKDTISSEKQKGEELKLYNTGTTTGLDKYNYQTDVFNYELSNNELYGKEIEPLWRCENDGGLSSYLGNYIINNNVSSSILGGTECNINSNNNTFNDNYNNNLNDGSKRLVVSNTNNVNRLISLNKYKLELNINELNRENYVLNLQLLLYTYINISNIYIYLIYSDSNKVSSNVNNFDNYNRLYNNMESGDSSSNEGNILLLNNNTNLNNNINKNNNININIKLDILNLVEFPILYIKLIENDGNINKLKLLLPIGLYLTLIPLKYNINNFNKLWNSMEMNVNKMTRLYLSKIPLDINNLLNLLWKYFSVYVNNNLLLLSSCGNEILLGSIYVKNKTLIVIQLRSISNNLIISTMNVLKEIFSVLNNKFDCSIYNFKLKNVNVLPLKFQTVMVNTTYPMNTNLPLSDNAHSNRYY